MLDEIRSSQNPIFKKFLSLLSSQGIKKEKQFLLSGRKIIQEYLNSLQEKLIDSKEESSCQLLGEIIPAKGKSLSGHPRQYFFSSELFRQLDELGTHDNLLILSLPGMKTWNPEAEIQGLELLVPLGDPNNLGAVLRSAEAFGVSKVILLQESAHPFLPKALKASSGAVLRTKLEKGPDLKSLNSFLMMTEKSMENKTRATMATANKSKTNKAAASIYWALDRRGESLYQDQWPKNLRLIIGEEGPGLGSLKESIENKKLNLLSIPMASGESLNAAVACSIALSSYYQSHHS